MTFRRLLFPLCAAVAIAAAGVAHWSFAANSNVVMRIDGRPYSIADLEREVSLSLPVDSKEPFSLEGKAEEVRLKVARTVAQRHVLRNLIHEAELEKDPEIIERLSIMKERFLVDAYLARKMPELVSDADIQAKYQEVKDAMADKEEVRARHILVENEDAAKDVVNQLKTGADFAKLAGEKSTDPGSKSSGGDLGYFTREQMVPAFSDAAFALKKGEVSKPVHTDFGWHVIKLEDRRPMQVPPLKDVEQQLLESLEQMAFQDFMLGLLEQSKIEYVNSEGKPAPLFDGIGEPQHTESGEKTATANP